MRCLALLPRQVPKLLPLLAFTLLGCLLGSGFSLQKARAATMQNPEVVAKLVQQAAQNLVPPGAQVSIGTVSGAHYMPACTVPLSINISGVAPYEQATVQCASPRWTLYVEVTVEQSEDVVVAARPLTAGQTIGPGDIMLRSLPVQNFAGRQVFTTLSQVEGADLMMSLTAGSIITQNLIQTPLTVKAGQMVTVHVYSGNVTLSVDAVADQNGHIGDTIMLTNPTTGRRFTAEVTDQGVILKLSP